MNFKKIPKEAWIGAALFLLLAIISIKNVNVISHCPGGSSFDKVQCWYDNQIEDNIRDGRPANEFGSKVGGYYMFFVYTFNLPIGGMSEIGSGLYFYIFNIILGFMIGWFIHRRFIKK